MTPHNQSWAQLRAERAETEFIARMARRTKTTGLWIVIAIFAAVIASG